MKYLVYVYFFIFSISQLSSGDTKTSISNQLYLFTYTFNSPSLGPAEGICKLKILMREKNILSAWSLKTGLEYKDIHSFDILLHAINGETQNFLVEYDSNHFPKKIKPKIDKGQTGGWFTIRIEDFKVINDANYTIDIERERINEFRENYQKWMKINIVSYNLSYKDSKKKNIYIDGVWVVVKNKKVIKARDSRTFRPIKGEEFWDQSFFTISNLFAIVKSRLDNNQQITLLYHKKYGYPYLIAFKNSDGSLRRIFSRILEVHK